MTYKKNVAESMFKQHVSAVRIKAMNHRTPQRSSSNDVQYNLNGSNPDGSFTVDDSN